MKISRRGFMAATLSLLFGSAGAMLVLAATTPSLGSAITYGILADTYTNTSAGTTINGDVGFTTGPAVAPAGAHPNYGSGAPYASAGSDQNSALSSLASQPCTFNFPAGPVDLSTDTTHGPIGTYAPGVYCSDGAMDVGGPMTLSGSGTYIFRSDGALTSTAGAVISLAGGASACDIFWTPTQATTLAADTTFVGTVIDNAGITIGANTTWTGRALAFGGTVSTDTTTLTVPTCSSAAPPSSSGLGSINVVKIVINDNGGTKEVSDFPLFLNGTSVISGVTTHFAAEGQLFTVTETSDSNYSQSFSGDCSSSGTMTLNPGDSHFCVITNDDIGEPVVVPPVPPLIDVVKVPNPLALPNGPGSVTYTYTVKNIGTVTMNNVTISDDSCSPLTLVSGDTNNNSLLEVSETWTYRCTRTLSATHTNTVVATGWANGLSDSDVSTATVVVGEPIIPPLIHVTKVPNPLTLGVGGGTVTYTEKVTNPGTVPLNNVVLVDDKCSPMKFISGDSNGDSKLDPSETWTYTCQQNLTKTTTNTAIARGEANGFIVRDVAIATVVVATAAPSLPNTGVAPAVNTLAWILVASIVSGLALLFAMRKKQA